MCGRLADAGFDMRFPPMTTDTLIRSTDVAVMIEQAAANFRAKLDAEEAQHRSGQKSDPHPQPTKEEAWQAWAHAQLDREEPLDREAFERWWTGGEYP